MTSSVQFASVCLSFVGHFCAIVLPGGGGDSGFQVTGDNRKSFLSLKFSVPGFFGGRKIWIKSLFFLGALIQVKICFEIQNKLTIRVSACVSWLLNVLLIFCVMISFNAFCNFQGLEIRQGIFFRFSNFGPGIFSASEFYPHSIIRVTWNPPPPGLYC